MTKLIEEIKSKNDDIKNDDAAIKKLEELAEETHKIIKKAEICGCCDECREILTVDREWFVYEVKPGDKLFGIFPNGLGMFNIQCCSRSCIEKCLEKCPGLSGATIVEVSGKDSSPPSFENILNILSFLIRHPSLWVCSPLTTLKYIIDLKLKDTSELTWLERRFLNNLDKYQII